MSPPFLLRSNLNGVLKPSTLKLTSHGILHYLWSAELLKSFSQLIMSIFTFFNQQLFNNN